MEFSIEYCGVWDYYPNAASLADYLKKEYNTEPKLIESSGGVFEVKANGQLIFSKKQLGRFPDHDEVKTSIDSL